MRVDIRDVGKYGVVLDMPGHELPPNTWSSLRNVRCRDKYIMPIWGETQVFTVGTQVTDPLNLFYCPTVAGTPYGVYGGLDAVAVCDANGHVDISPAVSPVINVTENARWTGTWLNGVFIMNSSAMECLAWDDINPGLPALMKGMSDIASTEFQSTWRFNAVRAFKEILIGIGFTDGGASYPTTVKWSGPATAGEVPIAWDAANLNNIAGEKPLSATPGKAIDGMQLGNSFIICKEDATFRADFIQGSSPLAFKDIDLNSGVAAVNCMVEFKRGQMLIFNQNFNVMVTDGTQLTSILDDRLHEYMATRVDVSRIWQCFVVHNPVHHEVWICYPLAGTETSAGQLAAQEALVWNYMDNAMSFHDIGRMTHIGFGKTTDYDPSPFINDVDEFIDNVDTYIDTGGFIGYYSMIGCSLDRSGFWQHDTGYTIDDASFTFYFRRDDLAIVGQAPDGTIRTDHQKVKVATGVWPVFEIQGAAPMVDIRVGAQEYRDGNASWEGPYSFDPNVDQRVDFLIEGIYISVDFTITATESWKFHTWVMEFELAGDVF